MNLPLTTRRRAALLTTGASGFASLGYQIVWTEQSSLWLGHESAAVLAVVTAFFAGLSLGGLALGPYVERSLRPVRWYAASELLIALWGLLLSVAWRPISAWAVSATGATPSPGLQWSIAFFSTFLAFLPATAAMGATLPAMERLSAAELPKERSLAALYASNTCGAVLGVLGTAFYLIPNLGLSRSAAVCSAVNVWCCVAALFVFPQTVERPSPSPACARTNRRSLLLRLAATGLLGIGYEVLVVRVLSQVTEGTVYTFALLLAVYLVGSALGAAAYQRWLKSARADREALGDQLLAAMAGACLLGTSSLWLADAIKQSALTLLGRTLPAALATEALLAVLAFGAPTLLMGALFSHLSRAACGAGVSFGRALGVNTLGAAAAPVLCGVLAVPTLGSKATLLLIPACYLACSSRRAWLGRTTWLTLAAALGLGLLTPALRFVEVSADEHLVSYEEGVMAAVSVVEDASGVARLHIDNRQQEGSSATRRVDARQAWLPLLLHPSPRHALFLGLGTGVTASSATEDPGLAVDAVELLPEVVAASHYFIGDAHPSGGQPRLHVWTADARRYVRATAQHYDVIVSDNFHPARSGSGALYTVEHFQAVRRRLAPSGLFCQWLPLHQLDLDSVRSIGRSFSSVFPVAWAMIANNGLDTPVVGLVAREDGHRFDLPLIRARIANRVRLGPVTELGLDDEFAVLGSFVAGPAALRRFVSHAALNTDDRPVVAYGAPLVTYAPNSSPRERLLALLEALSIEPEQLLETPSNDDWLPRLARYFEARKHFIQSGQYVRRASTLEQLLEQVREPLLSVLRISPDFRPAYDPLLAMAKELARSDASSARALFSELTQVQPARGEAAQFLDVLLSDASSPAARH